MTAAESDRRLAIALLSAVAVAVVLLRLFDPATAGIFPPCPLRALTGWYCPGCGSLRAFHQLLHGNLRAAFAMNPLAVLSLPFLTYGLASYSAFAFRGHYLPRVFLPAVCIRGLGIVIVLFGIVRNFQTGFLPLLAPGGLLTLR